MFMSAAISSNKTFLPICVFKYGILIVQVCHAQVSHHLDSLLLQTKLMELSHVPNFSAFWYMYLHVIILFLFHPTTHVKAIRNDTDRLALLKFKEAIATDPYGFLNSWNDSLHYCNWHGITCGRRHQRVVAMNLSHSDLHGTISPYIGNLSFLRFINLRNNSFSGKIPQQVDHLFRLRHLNLSYNMLEGGIPVNLTFCPELSIISLAKNILNGQIPSEIGLLEKLEHLEIYKNNLTGRIPPSLGNLSSISRLILGFNNLVGSVPEEIGRLQSLSVFYIDDNQFSGTIPPSIFNISSMKDLALTSNNFKGSIPPGVGVTMPNLQIFELGENELSGQFPASFSNSSHLQILDIPNNFFVGQIPSSIGNLPDLRWLGLSTNNLGSNSSNDLGVVTSLTNCSKLEVLDMSENNFGGILPNSVANLSTQLTKLYFGVNHISGMIPAALANLNNLIVLDLHDNLFTGVIPTSFSKFQKLQKLGLDVNRLSGQIPSSIGNLTQLFQLLLEENNLEGSIPQSIGNCQNLQYMTVSHNSLSGNIPPQVIGLSSLSLLLNLSQNSLTGNLPVEVGKLKNINTLDISDNNLSGEIPDIIGTCLGLQFLFLQGNLFQGIIPSSLASLKNLEYLDLSRNNFSGKIPKNLQTLPFLLHLNLSFNNLEGEVPKEGAFRNTSAILLVGNPKLCGGVSELQLPACPVKAPNQRKSHGFNLKLTVSLVAGCSLLFAFLFALYWRRKQKKKPLSAESSISFLSKVSYQTIYQATGGFSPSTLIGSGSFGSVYKGILDQEENKAVAIKVLNLQQKGASKSFTAECNALRNIRHRNLVKILTCCASMDNNGNEFKALVFEYMSNGSLEEWLHSEDQSRSLNLLQRLNIAVDVASALCYLHEHSEPQIIHRDMKPSNVLLDDDMVARVGDFGLARLIMDSSQNQTSTVGIKGTIGYAAPEYASGVEASKQGDVYSYGILVLEMFTGRRPTDELFRDGLNLHNFVKMAIPGRLVKIVDPALLATLEETATATTENELTKMSRYNNEVEAGEQNTDNDDLCKMNAYLWNCIFPILKIGLACSEELPRNRMSMEDVHKDLHHIQKGYNGVQIRQERPRRR
ncbi:probable LRR receptor-like serine/threonine-protein kinase At3g47570 [Rosa rugosa]|uniref:probable LRR receptor-like serine/threonine-protein kinase At3g47570 n=1 Tax=Rosa rugosa TaxID=74645 RepID=UPI002B40BAA9|nr:probable LRR receptor-like serine/threonine-protein kinase At3g47570 [Rosa rugosa]